MSIVEKEVAGEMRGGINFSRPISGESRVIGTVQ